MKDPQIEQAAPAAEQRIAGPPSGLGRDINGYLNHYVTVADAKAGSGVAASLTIAALLLSDGFTPALRSVAGMVALGGCAASIIIGLAAVFPRLPKGHQGFLFWEDIRNHGTAERYVEIVRSLGNAAVEDAYARQNFHVASVVHQKLLLVRWTIAFLLVGCVAAAFVAWTA